MVESMGARYKLFDDWKKTGVCTLTGSELESLEAKRRSKSNILFICLVSIIVAAPITGVMLHISWNEYKSAFYLNMPLILLASSLLGSALWSDHRSKRLFGTAICDREYTLSDNFVIIDGKIYYVYLDDSCKHIIIQSASGENYTFDFELAVMNDNIIQIRWVDLKVVLSAKAFHGIAFDNKEVTDG